MKKSTTQKTVTLRTNIGYLGKIISYSVYLCVTWIKYQTCFYVERVEPKQFSQCVLICKFGLPYFEDAFNLIALTSEAQSAEQRFSWSIYVLFQIQTRSNKIFNWLLPFLFRFWGRTSWAWAAGIKMYEERSALLKFLDEIPL